MFCFLITYWRIVKLILTCLKDYQNLFNCTDLAYEPDCKAKATGNLCNINLADTNMLKHYCQKSCGFCSSKINSQLSCKKLAVGCNGGQCQAVNYFGVASIKCQCGLYVGTYCQTSKRTNIISLKSKIIFFPC